MRTRGFVWGLCCLAISCTSEALSQSATSPASLRAGDAVVTGFSGLSVLERTRTTPPAKTDIDLTFINPDGASARIVDVAGTRMLPDGRFVDASKRYDVLAKDAGQVFGIALDDASPPNIYLSATSLYGLNLVARGSDGHPERRRSGAPGVSWMRGQFGSELQGDPGSIYKVDGKTGLVTLFTQVQLNGVGNPAPGLGNIAFDATHRQLIVSDLYTGMIHRYTLDGREGGKPYDHGITGRGATNQPTMAFDVSRRPTITNSQFKTDEPTTWGFAPVERRVFAVAVHEGRLYYSARNGARAASPQVWSVGILRDGSFGADARLEVDVPAQPGPYTITDIAFSPKGALLIAQRANVASSYDYKAFTQPGEPRVLRFWLKTRDDPPSPGLWKLTPEEIEVGFADKARNTTGGLAFGYGRTTSGEIDVGACDAALLITGERLRLNDQLRERLQPGGAMPIDGLQIGPETALREDRRLDVPWASAFVDYDDKIDGAERRGWIGSVRTLRVPCSSGTVASANGGIAQPHFVDGTLPPSVLPPLPPVVFCPSGVPCGPPPVVCVGACGTGITPVDLSIKKKGATSPAAHVNNYIYTLAVSNNGGAFNAPGGIIAVNDVVPAGMTFASLTPPGGPAGWTCSSLPLAAGSPFACSFNGGSVPPGAVATITINATANGPPPYPPFANCGTIGIAGGAGLADSDPTNNVDCVTVSKPGPDLAIKKTGATSPAPHVNNYLFNLAVSNAGAGATASAGVVSVTDIVPAGMTFVSATMTGTGWTCTPGPITAGNPFTCTYAGGALPPGPLTTITINAIATGAAPFPPFSNCATVAIGPGTLTDNNPTNDKDCVTVTKPKTSVDLALKKTGFMYQLANDTGIRHFTLSVSNTGAAFNAAAGVISINDIVPAGMTLVSATSTSTNWTCPTGSIAAGGTLTCTFNGGTLPAGALTSINILGQMLGSAPFPPVTNCGTVDFDPSSTMADSNAANDKDCVTLKKADPVDLAVKKTGATPPDPNNHNYLFTLTAANNGPAFNAPPGVVMVSDVVPPGMIFNTATAPAGWTCTPSGNIPAGSALQCVWGGGPLPAGPIAIITVAATATGSGPYPPVTNCATVGMATAGVFMDTVTSNNKDCVTVSKPPQNPSATAVDLSVKKTSTVAGINGLGIATVNFLIVVTNSGPSFSPGNTIAINDTLPPGMTLISANGTGWACSGSLVCTHSFGSGAFAANATLPPIAVIGTIGPGSHQNCAAVGMPSATTLQDTDVTNNTSCVTFTIPGTTNKVSAPDPDPPVKVDTLAPAQSSSSSGSSSPIVPIIIPPRGGGTKTVTPPPPPRPRQEQAATTPSKPQPAPRPKVQESKPSKPSVRPEKPREASVSQKAAAVVSVVKSLLPVIKVRDKKTTRP